MPNYIDLLSPEITQATRDFIYQHMYRDGIRYVSPGSSFFVSNTAEIRYLTSINKEEVFYFSVNNNNSQSGSHFKLIKAGLSAFPETDGRFYKMPQPLILRGNSNKNIKYSILKSREVDSGVQGCIYQEIDSATSNKAKHGYKTVGDNGKIFILPKQAGHYGAVYQPYEFSVNANNEVKYARKAHLRFCQPMNVAFYSQASTSVYNDLFNSSAQIAIHAPYNVHYAKIMPFHFLPGISALDACRVIIYKSFDPYPAYLAYGEFHAEYLTECTNYLLMLGYEMGRSMLERIHRFKLCHLDIKLDNFIVEDRGKYPNLYPMVSPIDFGFACPSGSAILSPGSPHYVAPEIFDGNSISTQASDVFSAGKCVLYALGGRFPNIKSKLDIKHAAKEKITPDTVIMELDLSDEDRKAILLAIGNVCAENPDERDIDNLLSTIENILIRRYLAGMATLVGDLIAQFRACVEHNEFATAEGIAKIQGILTRLIASTTAMPIRLLLKLLRADTIAGIFDEGVDVVEKICDLLQSITINKNQINNCLTWSLDRAQGNSDISQKKQICFKKLNEYINREPYLLGQDGPYRNLTVNHLSQVNSRLKKYLDEFSPYFLHGEIQLDLEAVTETESDMGSTRSDCSSGRSSGSIILERDNLSDIVGDDGNRDQPVEVSQTKKIADVAAVSGTAGILSVLTEAEAKVNDISKDIPKEQTDSGVITILRLPVDRVKKVRSSFRRTVDSAAHFFLSPKSLIKPSLFKVDAPSEVSAPPVHGLEKCGQIAGGSAHFFRSAQDNINTPPACDLEKSGQTNGMPG